MSLAHQKKEELLKVIVDFAISKGTSLDQVVKFELETNGHSFLMELLNMRCYKSYEELMGKWREVLRG